MAKFVFNMQSLLNIKEKLEEQSKTDYGKAIANLEEEKEKLIMLEEKKVNNLEGFKESIELGVNPNKLQMINQFTNYIKTEIQQQILNIQKAEQIVEEKRLVLLERMKDKKALETLKEKKEDEHFQEELQKEQKIIDEIVSFKYNKKD